MNERLTPSKGNTQPGPALGMANAFVLDIGASHLILALLSTRVSGASASSVVVASASPARKGGVAWSGGWS